MSKHTPGPWVAEWVKSFTGKDEYWINFELHGSIATVRHGASDRQYGGKKALHANARLIAAAPELLEALKEVRKWIMEDASAWEASFAAKVDAVIAKAEGRT